MKTIFFTVQMKYFIFAILIIGTIGIWLPFLLAIPLEENIPISSLPINLTTFYVSIYFAGCVESLLKIFDDLDQNSPKSKVLNTIGLMLLAFFLTISTIFFYVLDYIFISTFLATIGSLVALYLWWSNNSSNPTFNEIIRKEAKKIHGKNW